MFGKKKEENTDASIVTEAVKNAADILKEDSKENAKPADAEEVAKETAEVKENVTESAKPEKPAEDWQSKYNALNEQYTDLQKKYTERFSGMPETETKPTQGLINDAKAAEDFSKIDFSSLFEDSEGMMKQPDKSQYPATPNTTTNQKGTVDVSTTPYKPAENKASTGGFSTSLGNIGTATRPRAEPTANNNASTGAFKTSPSNIGAVTFDSLFKEEK